jgi:hypothetical protein
VLEALIEIDHAALGPAFERPATERLGSLCRARDRARCCGVGDRMGLIDLQPGTRQDDRFVVRRRSSRQAGSGFGAWGKHRETA